MQISVFQELSPILICFDENDECRVFGINDHEDTAIEAQFWLGDGDGLEEAINDIKEFFATGKRPPEYEVEDYHGSKFNVFVYSDNLSVEFGEKEIVFIEMENFTHRSFPHGIRENHGGCYAKTNDDLLNKLETGLEFLKTGHINLDRLMTTEHMWNEDLAKE